MGEWSFAPGVILSYVAVGAASVVGYGLTMIWAREQRMVRVRQGERGRWRWHAYTRSGRSASECPVYGFATAEYAEQAARAELGQFKLTFEVRD